MKKIGSSILIILFFHSAYALAEVKLMATVDKTNVTQEDVLTLSLTITGDSDLDDVHPSLPDLKDFEVMGSYVKSSSTSRYMNGKFVFLKQLTYDYQLSPQKAGTIVIGAATLDVDGKKLESAPIKITVTAAGSNPKSQPGNMAKNRSAKSQPRQDDDSANVPPGFGAGGLNGDDEDDLFTQLLRNRGFMVGPGGTVKSAPQMDKNAFFISVEANKKKVYVGEQIVATWYLYTKGSLTDFDALKYPELKGFWKEDLEISQRLNFQQEVVNGAAYNRALLVSYAIFPIAAGRKIIDPFKAKATVIDTSGGGMGMFGMGHPYTYTKSSQELPIEVMPLPTEGRPASFSGAVGKFNITGSLSSSSVKVNQPVSLKIRFQGKGNVKAIELPHLDLPTNLEIYDTKRESQFSKTGDAFIEFEVLVIPRNIGDAIIPPMSLSFFDPQTAKYVVKQTPEFKLKVLPGDGSGSVASSPLTGGDNAFSSAPVIKELRFLKTSPSKFGFSSQIMMLLWALMFLAPLAWLLISWRRIYLKHKFADHDDIKKRARLKLKTARKKCEEGDWRSAGVEITNAVLSVLGQVSGAGGVAQTAEQMMNSISGLTPELREKIISLLSHCEVMSFAPEQTVGELKKDQKILNDAEKILSALFDLMQAKTSGTAKPSA